MAVMQYDSPTNAFIAALIFAAAALTDALDGYLARRMGQVSVIGKLLDPLADKLIVMGTLGHARRARTGSLPGWFS